MYPRIKKASLENAIFRKVDIMLETEREQEIIAVVKIFKTSKEVSIEYPVTKLKQKYKVVIK